MISHCRRLLATTTALVIASTAIAAAEPSAELIAAAKKEGMLTTIALPHDWCGYGDVIAAFKAKYPEITVNELNPDAGSADEVEAVKANKDNKGPQAPDVIDVGLAFGPQMKAEGLLQPYKVSTWDEIPDNVKDPEGYWYGDYYGVMSFFVNKDLVKETPKDWADLLKADYSGQVALAGDPRASNQAILGVLAAGLSTGAKSGKEAGEAGLKYFADLNKAGNFLPTIGKAGTLAQGATPIIVAWDYNALSWKKTLNDRSRRSREGRSRRCLRAGHFRLRPASECCQAVDGAPLLRRRSARLAEGLLPPDPLQRHGQGRQGSAGPDRQPAAGSSL